MLVCASASIHWIACRLASGWPKVTRCFAQLAASSIARCAVPIEREAICSRRTPSRRCIGLKALCSSPSRLAAGITASWKATSKSRPPTIVLIRRTISTPGVSLRSTRKALNPERGFSSGSVTVITIAKSERSAPVMKVLVPLST